MKKSFIIVIILILTTLMTGCIGRGPTRDYRQDMRDFVQEISAYAKGIDPGFIIIPQNGHELVTENDEEAE